MVYANYSKCDECGCLYPQGESVKVNEIRRGFFGLKKEVTLEICTACADDRKIKDEELNQTA